MQTLHLTQPNIDPSTRSHILDVASRIFAENGYERTTIRAICKAAKVNISLISYYFDGKDGLYREIFKRMQDSRIQLTSSIFDSKQATSVEAFRLRLTLFYEQMIEAGCQDAPAFKLIHNEMREGFPRVKEQTLKYFERMNGIVSAFMKEAQKRGFLRADVDLKIMGMMMCNMMMGPSAFSAMSQAVFGIDFFDKKDRTRMVRDTLQIYFDGILRRDQ